MSLLITTRRQVLALSAGFSLVLTLSACGSKQATPVAVVEAPTSDAEKAYQRGLDAGKAGDWAAAQVAFADAHRLDSKMTSALVNQGIAAERAGNFEEAAATYRKVLDANPGDEDSASQVARSQVALEKYGAALKTLNEALQKNPESAKLLNAKAGVLRLQKKYKVAIETARKVLLRNPKDAGATKTLAMCYASQDKPDLAETFFRNALKLNPKDADIFVNLGLLAAQRGNEQLAMAEFQRALDIDPQNATAHANIGAVALKYRDYARASASYQSALGAGLSNCKTNAAYGYALEGAQKAAEAVKQLKTAYSMCPGEKELLFTVGQICLGQMRDNQCALEHFEKFKSGQKGLAKDHMVHSLIDDLKSMIQSESAPLESAPEPGASEGAAPAASTTGGAATGPQSAGAAQSPDIQG